MGIFTRMRDIVSSNINAMLDRAEDPEKLIRLMIQEMEDTLVEVKASCAGAMAQAKRVGRELSAVADKVTGWEDRAGMAVDRGREDLAREALAEKRRWEKRRGALEHELIDHESVVERYQDEITQLEEKLAAVREKQRILVQRHLQARYQKRTRDDMRRADSSDVLMRFAKFENRVERMEAEADLAGPYAAANLNDEFDRLAGDEEIESELEALKAKRAQKGQTSGASGQ